MSEEQTLPQALGQSEQEPEAETPAQPFVGLAPTPQSHFRLYFYAAVLHLLEQMLYAFDSLPEALEQFPFLTGYFNTLAEWGLSGIIFDEATAWWHDAVQTWEDAYPGHLPLRTLGESAGMDSHALTLLISIGLLEEDVRFGALFEALQGTQEQHRPIIALLDGWWQARLDDPRSVLQRLLELGLIQAVNPDAPRLEWALQVPAPIWDALRGETPAHCAPGLRYQAPDELLAFDQVIGAEHRLTTLPAVSALLATGEARTVIVRGPQHNGRHTVLGAIARSLGCGLLVIEDAALLQDERRRLVGVLATLLNALPLIELELAPGGTTHIERLPGYYGPLGLVLGQQGGVQGSAVEQALTLTLEMPDQAERRAHWVRGANGQALADLETLSQRFRMTGGNLQRTAQIAQAYARLNQHESITVADAQQASRALNRQVLDSLATRLEATGDWQDLAINASTLAELRNLETRCRLRERLRSAVSPMLSAQLNQGVRALFSGPSGTGKTHAARLLASVLQMDIYRLDLSSVVNKYIGETEKNLNQLFGRAEELDVILLLDEGDALLTQRTSVQSSNDRYANLETNFLLQRLESFAGILIVTTNAGERIDGAFKRRMDIVVEFHPPDSEERLAIWQLHLPQPHAIEQGLMHDVISRCTLTGGQIRNAALHASLLALNNGGLVKNEYLVEAIQREYRKMGGVCPLRVKGN